MWIKNQGGINKRGKEKTKPSLRKQTTCGKFNRNIKFPPNRELKKLRPVHKEENEGRKSWETNP